MTASGITPVQCDQLVAEVKPFTMVPSQRLTAFVIALEKVVREGIPGDIVECGVWRGGVLMLAAKVLRALGDTRRIWLYDTYKGMTKPEEIDRRDSGKRAAVAWEKLQQADHNDWCYASLDDVRANMASTGYPEDLLTYVEGDVVETLKRSWPEQIAILRLDTDWYASTKAELDVLFPKLSPGGYLLVDDYGDWQGSRQAVHEYFAHHAQTAIAATTVQGSLVARRAMTPQR